ncbi:MAG TPA: polysaccharide deacetylase family protein, partial [Candidatus Udaeobacter sp.]|nr:polysaccharide deacetylase family protein [Candidatus Udaeobacter sp.]
MRAAARHVAVVLGLALAAAYLVQADDSTRPAARPAAAAAALEPALVSAADTGGRDYFVARQVHDVIPLGSRSISVPILMYHYIRPSPSIRTDMLGYRLSVTPQNFEVQMDWLYAHGFHAVNFNDLRAYFAGRTPLPAKPVIITLDDGYRDLYTAAYPVLQAHRFTAVAYIVTSFVNQPAYVTAAEVVEMDRAGIEIASHTIDHSSLGGRASFAADMHQLVQSKQWL